MARIRNIKPEFFTSETVAELPLRARLTWIGLWTHCDNHGRARDNVKIIKGALWPLDDVSNEDVEEDLSTLAKLGRIVRYTVSGKRYLVITNWGEHQYGAFKGDPRYPGPVDNSPEGDGNASSPGETEKSRQDLDECGQGPEHSSGIQGLSIKGQGEGTRENARPSPHCDLHPGGTDKPCRGCAEARRAAEAWDGAQVLRSKQIAREVERAIADPRERCHHDTDGGLFIHPLTGQSATCAFCRQAVAS